MLNAARAAAALLTLTIGIAGPAMAQYSMAPIADSGESATRRVRPHTPILSAQDVSILGQSFDLANRGQWDAARSLASSASDPIVRRLTDWRYCASDSSGADFQTITQFIAANPDWPAMSQLRTRAETAMPHASMSPDQIIAWFGSRTPASGDGFIKLGDAHIRNGDRSKGEALIRRGWIDADPTEGGSTILFGQYASLISNAEHEARLSRLLWQNKQSQALSMAGRVSEGAMAAATARIRLQAQARNADEAYSAVPSSHRNDAGLLFDRARWLVRRDRESEAATLLIQSGDRLNGPAPTLDAWWDLRNRLARDALDRGQYDTAYSLAAGHRIRYEDNLADFAEGEFLAGWIALQFQNKPDAALAHFRRLRQGVTAPISVARAHYWAGRALAKAGRDSDARAEYSAAGNLPLTFYGQLALQQISPKVRLSVPAGFKPGNSSAFRERPVIRAIWALADLGDQARMRTFVTSAADGLTDGQDYANLVQLVRDLGETGLALRVAKRGLQKNIPLFDLAYPTIPAPAFAGNGTAPETAMVLGLTRQESEFDSQAISRANAQGLMQLIPSTARMTAKRHGLPYDGRNTLLDPTGNMRLGMAHLSDVIADFAGSYVMAIGAYNAGGGRINEWVGRFGDPRAPNVDVVDWIERVPFSETRNYIQRVLENTQVYRAILNGREAPMTLAADLKRGTYTTLAAAQFTSDPNSQRASSPPAPQVAAIRSSPIVPDEDEKRPQIDPKPKAESKAKSAKESKAKHKAKGKSKSKAQAKAGAKKAKPNARVEATPKCKPGSKSAQCRKGRPG